ncbi:MAG: TonB-dependent receptor [Chlorobi bacterium]|nr:TonB-dependent receptor [Chlorobiota bacterium]
MKIKSSIYYLLFFLISINPLLYAQTGSLSGVISDAKEKSFISSATVTIRLLEKDAKLSNGIIGRISDKRGNFNFEDVPIGNYQIKVSYVGYITSTQNIEVISGKNNVYKIELTPDIKSLQEVLVTGASGKSQKGVAEVSVSRVDAAALTKQTTYDGLSQLLAGKIPGVKISTTSGSAGNGFRFDVRSGGGLNGTGQPAIILDGVWVNNNYKDIASGGQVLSELSAIDAESIETVEVLKGSAATALFGASGSNGVVIIKTKKGLKNQVPGSYTIDLKSTIGRNEQSKAYTKDMILTYQDANNVFRKGNVLENSANVNGNGNGFNYFFGYTSRDEEGILRTNEWTRKSLRANFQTVLSNKLTIGVNSTYMINNTTVPDGDNALDGYLGATCFYGPVSAGGAGSYSSIDSAGVDNIRNYKRDHRLIASIDVNYIPFENFGIKAILGYDALHTRNDTYYPSDQNYFFFTNGFRYAESQTTDKYNLDLSGDYSWRFNDSYLMKSTIGLQGFINQDKQFGLSKMDFPSKYITDVGAGAVFQGANEYFNNSRSLGIYFNQELNITDKYFFSAGLRNDYSSSIGIDAPSIIYPHVSGAVRLDRIIDLGALNFFKLRSAYGESGVLPGLLDGSIQRWNSLLTGEGVGASLGATGNPSIKPERIKEFEIGLEFELSNSYGIDFTYFRQFANNSIFTVDLPPSTGLAGSPQNIGSIDGWGFEGNLYGRFFRTNDYQLDANLIWNYANNEVTDLGVASPVFGGFDDVNTISVGHPKAGFLVKKVLGADFLPDGTFNGTLVDTALSLVGTPVAPHNGSFSLTFRFLGDFTFNTLTEWSLGGMIYNDTRKFGTQFNNNFEYNTLSAQLGVTPDSNIKLLVPKTAEYNQAANRFAQLDPTQPGSLGFFESSDFIRLRELSLKYDATNLFRNIIPESFKNVSLAVSVHNLALFTKYSFPDPEVNTYGANVRLSRGTDFNTLQSPRSFFGTISIGF